MRFQGAILAGGLGTRLDARTGGVPKALIPLAGKPLLEHQLELCARHGLTRILLLVRHEHQQIRDRIGDGARFGVAVDYQVDASQRGTAGALVDALDRLEPTFFVLYGDTYLDVDLTRIATAHREHAADVTLLVQPSDHPQEADLLEVDADGFIAAFHPYPHPAGELRRNLGNAALYVAERAAIARLPRADAPSDLARNAFPELLRQGARLHAYQSPEYIKDVGSPDRLDRVEQEIAAGVPAKLSGRDLRTAVFLDRDGTLNRDVHRLARIDQVELLDGVTEGIARLNRSGVLAVVVTNQSVIARGELSAQALDAIHGRLEHLLGLGGAYLDRIYVCPHHPDAGGTAGVAGLVGACDCRKPATGMIDAACRDLAIDRRRSWLVGDATSDIEAGRRAGLRTILVNTGYGGRDGRCPAQPDFVAADLPAAVDIILGDADQ